MIRYADLEDAKHAITKWDGDPSSVVHIGDHGNSVFSYKSRGGEHQILRFTDPNFRSYKEVVAELVFVNHLHSDGVLVAPAVFSLDKSLAIEVDCAKGKLICSAVAFAKGIEVSESSPYWNDSFFMNGEGT